MWSYCSHLNMVMLMMMMMMMMMMCRNGWQLNGWWLSLMKWLRNKWAAPAAAAVAVAAWICRQPSKLSSDESCPVARHLLINSLAQSASLLNVKTIVVSKMTSHCAGTVHMREESERGIRKWEEMWFKTTAEDGERGAAVTCDGRLFHRRAAATGNALSLTVDRRVYIEHPETLMTQNVL